MTSSIFRYLANKRGCNAEIFSKDKFASLSFIKSTTVSSKDCILLGINDTKFYLFYIEKDTKAKEWEVFEDRKEEAIDIESMDLRSFDEIYSYLVTYVDSVTPPPPPTPYWQDMLKFSKQMRKPFNRRLFGEISTLLKSLETLTEVS